MRFLAVVIAVPALLARGEETAATNETLTIPLEALYRIAPTNAVVWPPPPPPDPARLALAELDAATNDFAAPPLIIGTITALAGDTNQPAGRALALFERNLLRDRVATADRFFRNGMTTNAIALLLELDTYLREPVNRSANFNRIGAYYFRLQQYNDAADYMKRAWDIDPGDAVSACNLAAVLMTVGRLDEALGTLLEIYAQPVDKPVLAFSIHFNLACVYSLKGETEKALQNLALAARIDPASTATSMGDPHLDALRADPGFISLQRSLEDFLSRRTGT